MYPEIYQILTCSNTCCMWIVEKVWRAGKENKYWLCRVRGKNTRQTYHFAKCWLKTLDKLIILPSAGEKHLVKLHFC